MTHTPTMTRTVQMTASHGTHYSVTRADGFTIMECLEKLGRPGTSGAGCAPTTDRARQDAAHRLMSEGTASHGWADFEIIK